jgi:hypothetical protein
MADALPLVKGTLDALVLKALAWGPMHGFEVTTLARAGSRAARSACRTRPCTRRCTGSRCAGSPPPSGASRPTTSAPRYYRLTAAGTAHLAAETARWVRYAEAVTGILTAPAPA